MSYKKTAGLALAIAVATAGAASAQIKMGVAGPITGPNAAFGAQLRTASSRPPTTSTRPAASSARRSRSS